MDSYNNIKIICIANIYWILTLHISAHLILTQLHEVDFIPILQRNTGVEKKQNLPKVKTANK